MAKPSDIPSDATGGTAYASGVPSSGGGATRFDDLIGEFADAGLELPPELLDEQRAVFLRPGDVVGGRFEVVKPLGFGGMGAVYHVKDRQLHGEDKALKVMLPSLVRSETAQERFRSEVGISQKLRHESIVTVFDLAEDKDRGIRFFTMEYVPGVTLHRLLKDRGGQLPLDEALDIARQICDALDYAHHYTIHRDLKPQNIMVRADGRIKLLDFGLAKLMSPGRLTKSSMALGTAYYQAPEQSVRLAELDARADIYSLGVILYQMLTSRIPLGMSKPPSQLVRNLPKALDAVVTRCLQPEPGDRYASAAALRAALDAAVSRRRRPWAYAAVAVLAVAAVAAAWLAFVPGGPIGPIRPIGQIALEQEAAAPAPATPAPPTTAPPAPAKPAEEPAAAPTPVVPAKPELESLGAPAPADSTTVAEASAARKAALKAQAAAKSAGAESYAAADLAAGDELLKQAEARDTLREYSAAVASYKAAAPKYAQAEVLAKQVSAEVAALEAAKTEAAAAKAEADAVGAETWAKVRYKQAAEAEQAALKSAGRADATEKFSKAKDLYKLAAGETREQGEAIVAAAEKTAEQAKARAQTDDVKQYAAEELAQAEAQIAAAKTAGPDYQKAKTALEQAAALFAKAVEVVPARKKAEQEALAAEAARKKGEEDRLAAEEKAEQDRIEEARKQAEAAAKAAPQPGEARTFAGIEMVWIPPGEFMMGSPESEEGRSSNEGPQHRVTIARGFWLGKYEVTNAQFRKFVESAGYKTDAEKEGWGYAFKDGKWDKQQGANWRNPGWAIEDAHPVVLVSWNDAQAYIAWLNKQSAGKFSLPSEAEWEYACRAGTTTAYPWGNAPDDGAGWCNAADQTAKKQFPDWAAFSWSDGYVFVAPVGRFKPNKWGLHDTIGNVWEWCQDWYHDSYNGAPTDGSAWESPAGQSRVLRGGSWYLLPGYCRSAPRRRDTPAERFGLYGFRSLRTP